MTFWFREPEENLTNKKPQTPSPTTPSPKGENTCEICGKKTQDHSTDELKNCIAESINKSITKTTWFR